MSRFAALLLAALGAIAAAPAARADLLPISPLPPERSLWVSFEILPVEPAKTLPESLRQIESARLQSEEAVVNGQSYRKTSIVLPLPNGDRREVILLLAEESGHMRMLGYHHILRHQEAPQGATTVFQSGSPNPLTGEPEEVPADTYTYLALCTALSGFDGERPPFAAHLWSKGAAVPVDIVFDGKEKIDALGSRVAALRVRLRPKVGASGEAVFWFSESEPRTMLQYRGPGDFLAAQNEPAPNVLLRATASSEQVRSILRN